MLELTKSERRTLMKLLFMVDDEETDLIDLFELFSREDFKNAGMILEKLKQCQQ